MLRIRHLSLIAMFCSLLIADRASAQAGLTQIQDTVVTPTGSPFNGTVVVSWSGSILPTGNGPVPYSTAVKIYNGALSVLLVPSTGGNSTGYYRATYNSSDGLVTWAEYWSVPPTAAPLKLTQIRVSAVVPVTVDNSSQVSINQVSGLSAALAALNTSVSTVTGNENNLTSGLSTVSSQVSALSAVVSSIASQQATATTTGPNFVDAETPSGAVNGSNVTFTLSQTPASGSSISLYRDGILLSTPSDYMLSGTSITFGGSAVPQTGDSLLAYYRIPGTGPFATFVDVEVPSGSINGQNLVFTLASAPNPVASLRVSKNGVLLQQNADYTISSTKVTFTSAAITPQTGDSLSASYRH